MKLLFGRYNFIRALRRSREDSSFIVNDSQSVTNLVLRIINKREFDLDRAAFSRFYAWFQTQCHPHLGRMVHAGVGSNHELYWARPYCDATAQVNNEPVLRNLLSTVAFLHSEGYV